MTGFVLREKPRFDRMFRELLIEEADRLFDEVEEMRRQLIQRNQALAVALNEIEELRAALVEAQEIGLAWQREASYFREQVN